jgi:hypothetical protein
MPSTDAATWCSAAAATALPTASADAFSSAPSPPVAACPPLAIPTETDLLAQLLQLLLAIPHTEEEVRSVLAECLGRLATLYPEPVLAALQQQQAAEAADKRSVAVGAIKHMMSDKAGPVDAALKVRGAGQ